MGVHTRPYIVLKLILLNISSTTNMNTTFNTAIAQLTIADIEHIDTIVDALKARKKDLRTEKSELIKAEKAELKRQDKAAKDAAKAQAKAQTKAQVDLEKAAAKAERDAEKAAKAEIKNLEKAAAKAERDADKAAKAEAKKLEAEQKKVVVEAEKAEAKKAKEAAKTLASLQTKVLKSVKKETGEPVKPNNHYYQNFCKWSNGDEGPTEEEIKAAGGKREWNKMHWDKLSKEERAAPDAVWNVTA
jgi:chemotaxis protein histidine kinase CheA